MKDLTDTCTVPSNIDESTGKTLAFKSKIRFLAMPMETSKQH